MLPPARGKGAYCGVGAEDLARSGLAFTPAYFPAYFAAFVLRAPDDTVTGEKLFDPPLMEPSNLTSASTILSTAHHVTGILASTFAIDVDELIQAEMALWWGIGWMGWAQDDELSL